MDVLHNRKVLRPFRKSTPQREARNPVYIEWLFWLLIVAKKSFEHVVKFKYFVTTVTKDERFVKKITTPALNFV
jgi:hypothetical protein